jgi:hypothetical protein
MKILSLFSLILLVSCGNPAAKKDGTAAQCLTREEIRAVCYVDEMQKLGHDINMDAWVKNQCATIYATQGCYRLDDVF